MDNPRRSGRTPVPARNPEQQLIPLVDRLQNSNRRNTVPPMNEGTMNPPTSGAGTPPLVVREDTPEDHAPPQVPSIGMSLEATSQGHSSLTAG